MIEIQIACNTLNAHSNRVMIYFCRPCCVNMLLSSVTTKFKNLNMPVLHSATHPTDIPEEYRDCKHVPRAVPNQGG